NQRQFLPIASRLDLRGLAKQSAAGVPLCGQGQPLHHPHEEVARLPGRGRPLHRAGAAAGRQAGTSPLQLPPSLHKDVERLETFLGWLPKDLEQVVEFRHKSWYDEDVLALLDRYGVGFVTHDLKGLRSPRWASGRTAYVRFHGAAGKYWGRYSDEALVGWT